MSRADQSVREMLDARRGAPSTRKGRPIPPQPAGAHVRGASLLAMHTDPALQSRSTAQVSAGWRGNTQLRVEWLQLRLTRAQRPPLQSASEWQLAAMQ